MEKSKAGTKKDVPTAYHILKYNNNKRNMVIFYKKNGKSIMNSINKKQNGLK